MKSKMNLSKTSVILHFRRDCEERVRNLKFILSFLHDINFHEVFLINDDAVTDPLMDELSNLYPSLKIHFFKNEGVYMRPLYFNKIAEIAEGEVLCFYDVDVLIKPEYLKASQDIIVQKICDHVYPYNGAFINIRNIKEDFQPDFELFASLVDNTNIGYSNDNITICHTQSVGGCFLISKEAFNRINGYNPNFKGWGSDDTCIFARSSEVNKIERINNADAICWHLDHTRNDLSNTYLSYNASLK
jgi:predicted glycosyltransferase involved in capsule biosynthesis